jgi:PBP1b-binding outer membrane lipoprotein LpoB
MKTFIAIIALLFVAAILVGCTQNTPQQQPPQGQPSGQPQVTTPVEDIAAQQLETELPSGNENLASLNDMLINATS